MLKLKATTYVIMITSLLTGCRTRNSSSALRTDSVIQGSPSLFFGGNQAVQICIQMTDAVKNRLRKTSDDPAAKLKETILHTYAYWISYTLQKGVQKSFTHQEATSKFPAAIPLKGKPNDVRSVKIDYRLEHPWPKTVAISAEDLQKSFPVAIAFVDNCDDADLEVHFGTKPKFVETESITELNSVLGVVYTDKGENPRHKGWHRGAIVLQDQGDAIDYSDSIEPEFILMHEWGHVLGVPHVVGTVMDPEMLSTFAQDLKTSREFDPYLRIALFFRDVYVDRWRQLVVCHQGSCASPGLTMGLLVSEANINEKTGLDHFHFNYLGQLNSQNPTPTVARDLGKVDTETSTQIAEVFRRPVEAGAESVFHKSIVINRWLNKSYLTKAIFNGNSPYTPPISVQGDCKGKKIKLFESGFVYGYQSVLPWYWNPVKQTTPLLKTKEFADCVQDPNIFPEQTYLQIDQYQKQLLSNIIYNFETQQSDLKGSPRVPAQNLPQKHTYCAYQTNDVEICLYHHGNLAVMRIGNALNTSMQLLAPILQEGLQDERRFKLAWSGMLDMTLPAFSSTHFPIRVAISDDIGTAPQIQYEIDVGIFAGVWYPIMSGTMTPATKP